MGFNVYFVRLFLWNLMGFDVQNPCWLMMSSGIILPNILGIKMVQEPGIPFLTNQD
jgi:hypothetical protein